MSRRFTAPPPAIDESQLAGPSMHTDQGCGQFQNGEREGVDGRPHSAGDLEPPQTDLCEIFAVVGQELHIDRLRSAAASPQLADGQGLSERGQAPQADRGNCMQIHSALRLPLWRSWYANAKTATR
jgi:hypothetical protein